LRSPSFKQDRQSKTFTLKGGRFITHTKKLRDIDNPRRDVFVYFDNDAKVRAPYDAIGLATRLTS
jgi:uncharacterized protein YecE (DUF72 family)